MARIWRWTVCAGALGVLPLLLAYGVRYYHAPHAPPLDDVMVTGDAYVIAMTWCATALVDLSSAATSGGYFWSLVAIVTLAFAAVAYGCLTADLVTDGVQTPRQEDMVTTSSVVLLAFAAGAGVAGAVLAGQPEREEL